MAAIRSNRVKSELIVRGGIKEECFITKPHAKSHAADGDLVIVRLTVPAPEASATESEGLSKAEEERLAAERAEQERKAAKKHATLPKKRKRTDLPKNRRQGKQNSHKR